MSKLPENSNHRGLWQSAQVGKPSTPGGQQTPTPRAKKILQLGPPYILLCASLQPAVHLHLLLYCCFCCVITKLCPTLWDPMDHSPPGSSVHGISQARTLEWVAISSSRGSSQPRDWTCSSCIGRQILYHWAIREAPSFIIPFNKLVDVHKHFPEFMSLSDRLTSSNIWKSCWNVPLQLVGTSAQV